MRVYFPSEHNFQVYHAVHTDQMPRLEVAQRFGILPERVKQIVELVQQFVIEHGDDELLATPPEHLELGSLRLCYSKLNYFYGQLMQSRRQLGEQPLPQNLLANMRLIHGAMRISIEKTRLAGRIAKVELAMIEAGTLDRETVENVELVEADLDLLPENFRVQANGQADQPKDEDLDVASHLPRTEPPARGYTPPATSQAPRQAAASDPFDATLTEQMNCDAITAALERRQRSKSR
jgi:hypothetical protein